MLEDPGSEAAARPGGRADGAKAPRPGSRADGAEAPRPGSEAAAREICLRLLTAAPRTRAQLAAALRRRHVPDEVAAAVLERFEESGLIDDAAFAQAWVESRHHGRGLARRALSAELRQRGVGSDEVRAAVAAIGPEDEVAAARQLVARRLPQSRGRPLPARIRQLAGMLARKGYPPGVAFRVVREALEREREELGGDWPAGSAAEGGLDLGELGEPAEMLGDADGDDLAGGEQRVSG